MDPTTTTGVLDGIDLILSINAKALGYSTGCKISTSAETGERLTKEATSGSWKEKYVKSFSQEISADGCVLRNPVSNTPTYTELYDLMTAKTPVEASYGVRGTGREAGTVHYYKGDFVITSLELDGQAGDDAKYTVKLENTGAVTKAGSGISDAAE